MNALKKKDSETAPVKQNTKKTGKNSGVTPAKKTKTESAVKSAKKTSSKETDEKAGTGKALKSKKNDNPAEKFYKLLTEEDKDNEEKEVEDIDPESLARGDEPMSVVGHLDELRSRVLVILASFMIITAIAFYFSDIHK